MVSLLEGKPYLLIVLSLCFDWRRQGVYILISDRFGQKLGLFLPETLVIVHEFEHECPEHILSDFRNKVLIGVQKSRAEVIEFGEMVKHSSIVSMDLS